MKVKVENSNTNIEGFNFEVHLNRASIIDNRINRKSQTYRCQKEYNEYPNDGFTL